MERKEAIRRLRKLEGKDLISLAKKHKVTVWKGGKLNKGWAGHTLERYLGLPLNSSQSPNFGSWELKIVPVKRLKSGKVVLKETMAITMIDPVNVEMTPFGKSHLLAKLQKAVVCVRMFESKKEKTTKLVAVTSFDLDDPELFGLVKKDYEDVRKAIRNRGFSSLTGHMGVMVQPRTKGSKGSTSRAFYARKELLQKILDMKP